MEMENLHITTDKSMVKDSVKGMYWRGPTSRHQDTRHRIAVKREGSQPLTPAILSTILFHRLIGATLPQCRDVLGVTYVSYDRCRG
jgi:hypothetical protein